MIQNPSFPTRLNPPPATHKGPEPMKLQVYTGLPGYNRSWLRGAT